MTRPLFGREYRLTVVDQDSLGHYWEGLRSTFSVKLDGRKTPKARLEIYNLNGTSRERVKASGDRVLVEAGYSGVLSTVFTGEIARVTVEVRGADVVTVLECGDGEREARDSRISLSLGVGSTTRDLVSAVTQGLGLEVGHISPNLPVVHLSDGAMVHGPVVKYLDQIAEDFNADWWVADGALYLVVRGEATPGIAEVVSPDTGMIGSPAEVTKENGGRTRVTGVTWTMLLRPGARPGDLFDVRGRVLEGLQVARKVTHKGDTDGGPWYTKIQGVEANG